MKHCWYLFLHMEVGVWKIHCVVEYMEHLWKSWIKGEIGLSVCLWAFFWSKLFASGLLKNDEQGLFLVWHELKFVTLLESKHYSLLQWLEHRLQVMPLNVSTRPEIRNDWVGFVTASMEASDFEERCSAESVGPGWALASIAGKDLLVHLCKALWWPMGKSRHHHCHRLFQPLCCWAL